MNAHVRNWSENNQDSVRRRSSERQERVARWVPSSELRQKLFIEQTGLCALCGKPIESLQAGQVEHLTPAVRGGSNQYGNLALAHISCNREKANKTLGEYIEWRQIVGLPRCTYSTDKLKNAIAEGEIIAKAIPTTRSSRRRREAPIKVTWMPGKEPESEVRDLSDPPYSAMAEQEEKLGETFRWNTAYRFAGNLPVDDIRPNRRNSFGATQDLDGREQQSEVRMRDTTYRFRRQDLTDASSKFD